MESVLKKDNITCIIPFYNEDEWTLRIILYSLLGIPEITQIIVIDDGSESKKVYNSVVRSFTHRYPVKVIRLESNLGKSSAVSYGLHKAFNENILLFDADLENIYKSEFLNAISKYKKEDLDMLILKRKKSLLLVKLFRLNTLLSGERIIKKRHLCKILSKNVKGYELEVAINQYFIDKNLEDKCSWSPSSVENNYKFKKINFFKGIAKDIKMYSNLIRYVGFKNFRNQVFNFCK
jgi:hypothetical protein